MYFGAVSYHTLQASLASLSFHEPVLLANRRSGVGLTFIEKRYAVFDGECCPPFSLVVHVYFASFSLVFSLVWSWVLVLAFWSLSSNELTEASIITPITLTVQHCLDGVLWHFFGGVCNTASILGTLDGAAPQLLYSEPPSDCVLFVTSSFVGGEMGS